MWDIKDKIEQRKWGKYLKNARTREQKEDLNGEQEKQEIIKLTKKKKQYANWK